MNVTIPCGSSLIIDFQFSQYVNVAPSFFHETRQYACFFAVFFYDWPPSKCDLDSRRGSRSRMRINHHMPQNLPNHMPPMPPPKPRRRLEIEYLTISVPRRHPREEVVLDSKMKIICRYPHTESSFGIELLTNRGATRTSVAQTQHGDSGINS